MLSACRRRLAEDVREVAALLTSETVTNPLIHGRSSARLSVRVSGTRTGVEVSDDNSRHPQPVEQDDQALDGRGLAVLDMLAEDWGYATSRSARPCGSRSTAKPVPDLRRAQPRPREPTGMSGPPTGTAPTPARPAAARACLPVGPGPERCPLRRAATALRSPWPPGHRLLQMVLPAPTGRRELGCPPTRMPTDLDAYMPTEGAPRPSTGCTVGGTATGRPPAARPC